MSCTTTTTVCRDFAFSPKETIIHFQMITPPKQDSGRSLTDKAKFGQPSPLVTTLTMSPAPITPRKTPKATRPLPRRSTLPGLSVRRPSFGMKRRQTDPGTRAGLGLGISGLDDWEAREEERERELKAGKNVNGFTRCGRHSDEWLFGGMSLGKVMKKVAGWE